MATSNENNPLSVVVVMVPFLAQSHLNQLLQFAHVVSSSYDIPVHYITSKPQISQVKSRASNPLNQLTKIHFHGYEIPLPHAQITDLFSTSNNAEEEIRRVKASKHLREPVATLIKSLSQNSKRLVVVYDVLMSWVVQDVVSLQNAECYSFHCVSVFFGLAVTQKLDHMIHIPVPTVESCFPALFLDFFSSQLKLPLSDFKSGSLHNTCRAIEGSSIEILRNEERNFNRKVWAIGPLHKMIITDCNEDKRLMEWLDEQEVNSVLYISFGSLISLSDEQIREIAIGLEESGVKFIWVLREGDKLVDLGKRLSQVPDGFEERMKGMGMVVREWVPQVKILGHSSTGGFMSHCGWNSCMESIGMGVPLLTWPMQSDQPFNGLLITRVLKVGVAVMEWEERDELVTSSMISRGVRRIMGSDSEEGDEIRKRAVEMGVAVKRSVAEGGDCRSEWDSFIAHITR